MYRLCHLKDKEEGVPIRDGEMGKKRSRSGMRGIDEST